MVQFVPDRIRAERVNVGLILQAPTYGYAAMTWRRQMDVALRAIHPQVDAQLVRFLVRGMADLFVPYAHEPRYERLFPQQPGKSHPTHPEFLAGFRDRYGLLHITEPRTVLVSETLGLTAKLRVLRERLLEVHSAVTERPSLTKSELTKQVVTTLRAGRVPLVTQPTSFPGERWPHNRFDALNIHQNRRHLHFLSYEIADAPSAAAKGFVMSVMDLRSGGARYQDDHFGVVVQRPEHHRSNKEDYEALLRVCRFNRIAVFENHPDDIRRLTERLLSPQGLVV
ncbi:DUF3037 domain-containing protein [Deinococcus sonorensis]|uniref:DUF3037 domain-containing protein n=1 Tax=Deinococcus sonorensis KR-87 TaxID=694439 RepID=A0AAU7UH54_9DEIO